MLSDAQKDVVRLAAASGDPEALKAVGLYRRWRVAMHEPRSVAVMKERRRARRAFERAALRIPGVSGAR